MLMAKDIMTRELITVSSTTDINSAAKLLVEKGVNGIPVIDGETLVGIICQSDVLAQQKKIQLPSLFTLLDGFIPLKSDRHFEKEIQKIAATTVDQVMTQDPITINQETTIEDIASLMVEKNIHTLPVMDGKKLVGIVGKEDILRSLVQ